MLVDANDLTSNAWGFEWVLGLQGPGRVLGAFAHTGLDSLTARRL
jgi:hypothetical protein